MPPNEERRVARAVEWAALQVEAFMEGHRRADSPGLWAYGLLFMGSEKMSEAVGIDLPPLTGAGLMFGATKRGRFKMRCSFFRAIDRAIDYGFFFLNGHGNLVVRRLKALLEEAPHAGYEWLPPAGARTAAALLCADLLVRTCISLQGYAHGGFLETDPERLKAAAKRVHPRTERSLLEMGYGLAMRFDLDAFYPPHVGRVVWLLSDLRRSTPTPSHLRRLLGHAAAIQREDGEASPSPLYDLDRYPRWDTPGVISRMMRGLLRAALRDLHGSMRGNTPTPLVVMNLLVVDKCREYRLVKVGDACMPLVFGPRCLAGAVDEIVAEGVARRTEEIEAVIEEAMQHGRMIWTAALSVAVPGFHARTPMASDASLAEWK